MSQAGVATSVNPASIAETLTGNSGGAVSPDGANNINVLGASGVTVSGNPGTHTLTITVAASGITWNTIGASQALAVNNGYFCTAGGALSLSLPAVSNLGDIIEISLDGSTSFTITQGAGQRIRIGQNQTTLGGGGSLTSTAQGDSLYLVCQVANLRWNVLAAIGNPIIV